MIYSDSLQDGLFLGNKPLDLVKLTATQDQFKKFAVCHYHIETNF